MLRRVLKYIRDKELLQPHDKVLVCVSGGADSVALLDVLCRGGYECVVAHCNFHLRGEESDRDENFVRSLCSEKHVRLRVNHFDTFLYARTHNKSIELAARELRYAWFEQVAREEGCAAIAVAHHQNDQAETVLMNLRRGAGVKGLCGMRCKSWCPTFAVESLKLKVDRVPLIRPLLCTTHDYICHYLRDIRHIDWVEDSTNNDTRYRRNAIREELKSYTKAEIEHIAKTAEIMQDFVQKHTRHYGIIGKPLEHSFSKQWFTEFFEKNHVLADYGEFIVESLKFKEVDKLNSLKLDGYNVTYPYKEAIISYLDEVDGVAQKIGAVNVVKGKKGYNTDWIGFTKAIKPYLTKEDKKALILGTGGAAKAVNYALHKLGIKTQLVSRDEKKGLPYSALTQEIMNEHTIIVNCTPLGLYPKTDECPDIPYPFLTSAHLLFDCIYNPEVTLFMQRGQAQGARVVNGRKMLEEQAKAAWSIWRV